MSGNHPKAFTGGSDKTPYETFQTSSSEWVYPEQGSIYGLDNANIKMARMRKECTWNQFQYDKRR
jgi:hypothetical protein